MGRKGVSKRKPKSNSKPASGAFMRPGESQTVASVVKDKGAPLAGTTDGSNSSYRKNKKAR